MQKIIEGFIDTREGAPGGSDGKKKKNLPAVQETWVHFLHAQSLKFSQR